MTTAELVYQDRQQLLKLPEAFRFNSQTVYIRKDAKTGSLIVSEARPEWQAFLDAWDKLDGSEWELPRHAHHINRDIFEDWQE